MSENNSTSGSVWGSIIWIIIFVSIYNYFTGDKKDTDSTYTPSSTYYNSYTPSPNYSTSYNSNYSDEEEIDCSSLEPENPYDYDSGHYAGFEWGENGNYCSGNSQSFIEGCEEYERQDERFSECEDNQ